MIPSKPSPPRPVAQAFRPEAFSRVFLGFSSVMPPTIELEGAPSFALFAKGGFLRPNASDSLLLTLAFLFSSSALSLRTLRRRLPRPGRGVIFFFLFLSTLNSELSTPEPITP